MIPNKGDKIKIQKEQKNKNENIPMMSMTQPRALLISPNGD